MTVRNVGIVFSPTLNIPAPVFAMFLQQFDGIFGQEPDSHDYAPVEVTVTAPPLTAEDIRSPRRQKFQDLPTPSYDQHSFPSPQNYQQQQRATYDTGFTPLQPSYESQAYPTVAGPEYGSRAQTLASPAYDHSNEGNSGSRQYASENQNPQGVKSKRRESSMFGMGIGLGQKKVSSSKLRDDSGKSSGLRNPSTIPNEKQHLFLMKSHSSTDQTSRYMNIRTGQSSPYNKRKDGQILERLWTGATSVFTTRYYCNTNDVHSLFPP